MPSDNVNASPDLSHARTPPKVLPWWERTCWAFFVLGVVVVLAGLTVLVFFADHERARWWGAALVAWVMWLAFPLAAVNTFCAAKGFGKRREQIVELIRLSDPDTQEPERGVRLFRQGGSVPQAAALWVEALHGFRPEPYHEFSNEELLQFSLREYVDLLGAEVHAARVAAGRLAAALGGLFVAALQVYGKFAS